MENEEIKYLQESRDFLDRTHRLAAGPNKYKSKFGRILEGIFRKGYFTLQTITVLADLAEVDSERKIVFGGSILDLSRRVFEDLVYMEYINKKGKDKYTQQFFDYVIVDQKNDMDFLLKAGSEIDPKVVEEVNKKFNETPKKIRGRQNWAGQSLEQVVDWFLSEGEIQPKEMRTLMKIYAAGNRKNHTSPSDVLDHLRQEWLSGAANRDIEMGLMITYTSLVKIGLLAIDHIEVNNPLEKAIKDNWEKLNNKESKDEN